MRRIMMRSKIHRATVTDVRVDYEGSITLDADLMDTARILPHEQVHVLDVDNGERLITYAIPGPRGSGTVQVNGAAARLVDRGHTIIVIAYAEYDEGELRGFAPRVIRVDEQNRPQSAGMETVAI
ncbi:MAG TPA: aspartate 1-decarboxylase [Actinomycetota bacterium]